MKHVVKLIFISTKNVIIVDIKQKFNGWELANRIKHPLMRFIYVVNVLNI